MRTLTLTSIIVLMCASILHAQTPFENNQSEKSFFSLSNGSSFTASASPRNKLNENKVRTAHDIERAAFDMLNDIRRQRGMKALVWNESVAEIARQHSLSMATDNFFSHTGKDGKTVDERADGYGLTTWRSIGENIAFIKGVPKPADLAVKKWMESTSHRNNILKNNWSDSAIGVAVISGDTYYFTQVFLVK